MPASHPGGQATVSPSLVPTVVLISGRGSNMRVLAEQALQRTLPIQIRAVISDRPQAAGLQAAEELGIPTTVVPAAEFAAREHFDEALGDVIESHRPGIIVMAGFMRILGAAFVARFAGRMLNIHPSLLPKYRGLHTHRRALEAGDTLHGASVHFVTQELDGGPVILQGVVPIVADDTELSLSARVQRAEHIIYPQAVHWLAVGRLQWAGGQVQFDGHDMHEPQRLELI